MKKILIISFLLLSLLANSQGNFFPSYSGLSTIYIWTEPVSEVGTTYVYGGGLILDNGSGVTERGLVVHTSINPTTAVYTQKFTDSNAGAGAYSGYIDSLISSTLYYIRAYATNINGTVYGDNITFTTTSSGTAVIVPQLNTTIYAATTTTADLGGYINDNGGAAVTARGICYSTSFNPTTANSTVAAGSGDGSFSATLTSLTANTTYYARAYATNTAGTGYGNQITFTTLKVSITPIVQTLAPSSVQPTSATLGGSVISIGSAAVTDRGIVLAVYPIEPNVNNTKIQIGTGIGSYSQSVTGLTSQTIYNVKAYAINSVGISYGQQYTFQTSANTTSPIISTNNASSIITSSANIGGNITSDGGETIIVRGVQFGIDSTFSTYSIKDSTGTTGSYTLNIDNLQYNTKYFFRAYGTNSVGTSYGVVKTFTTLTPSTLPTYVDNGGITSSDSAKIVMNYPATVAATDLLVMVVISDNELYVSEDSEWIFARNVNLANGSQVIYYRKGETSLGGQSTNVTKYNTGNAYGIIYRFSNASILTDMGGTYFGEYCGGGTWSVFPNSLQLGCIFIGFLENSATTITNYNMTLRSNATTSDLEGARFVLLDGTNGQYNARWTSCPINQFEIHTVWNLNK